MGDIRRFRPDMPWFMMALGAIGAASGWLCLGRLAEPLGLRAHADVGAGVVGALLYGGAYGTAALIDQRSRRGRWEAMAAPIRVLLVALVMSLLLAMAYGEGWLHWRVEAWAVPALAEAGLVWLCSLPALCLAVQCRRERRERFGSLAEGWLRARVAQAVIAAALTVPWCLAPRRGVALVVVCCLVVASLPLALQALVHLQLLRRVVPLVAGASAAERLPYLAEPDLDYGFGEHCARHSLMHRRAYRQAPRSFTAKGDAALARRALGRLLHWSAAILVLGALQLWGLAAYG